MKINTSLRTEQAPRRPIQFSVLSVPLPLCSLCHSLFSALLLLLTASALTAQTISERLQKGLFEEEAKHNLPAAIEEYKAVIAEAEQQRALFATAIFRLAESYRKLGRHDEARPLYERILRDFSDQTQLVQRASTHLPNAPKKYLDLTEIPSPKPAHNFDAYERLFANSPDLLNSPATNLYTFLQHAALSGDIEMIEFLIKRGAKLERITPDKKDTPLMLAVRNGHKRAAEVLIQAGANVNAVEGGSTPLIIAASKGYNELTRLLLESGAKVNLEADNGYTALHAASASGQVEAIQILAKAGANLNADAFWHTPLAAAVDKRQSAAVEALIRLGADPNHAPRSLLPPLPYALHGRNLDTFDSLLTATNLDLNVRDTFGNTPLMMLVEDGYVRQVESLLAKKPDLNLTNDLGYTALHYAAFKNEIDYLQLLLQAGADPNILSESAGAPLHIASGGPFLVRLHDRGNVTRRFGDGSPSGYQNQNANISPDKIELLLKHNADPNLRDSRGNTPLAHAIGKSSLAAVTLLLGAEADPNIPDNQGNTALDHAHRSPRLWELLKQAGGTNSPPYQEALRSQNSPADPAAQYLRQHLNQRSPLPLPTPGSLRQIPRAKTSPAASASP